MSTFLQVEALSKSFGNHAVLSDVNFSVDAGETAAIMGSSGSGKSTLLNILGLLDSADSGTIRLQGSGYPKITDRKAMLLRRNCINYLFQSFALIDSMTVRQNILLALRYSGESNDSKLARIERTLASLGMDDKAESRVNELSGGEKQRVAICRAVLKPGNLILADEPTGSLDRKMAKSVMATLTEAALEFGKTLVVVTHDDEMAAQCGRIFKLESGRLSLASSV